jgi:hypothetical protein
MIENSSSTSNAIAMKTKTIVNDGYSHIRKLTINKYLENYAFKFLYVQVFIMDAKNNSINSLLHAIDQAPVRS